MESRKINLAMEFSALMMNLGLEVPRTIVAIYLCASNYKYSAVKIKVGEVEFDQNRGAKCIKIEGYFRVYKIT